MRFAFVAACLAFTGCVSPFFATARIEPGLSVDAGVCMATYHFPATDAPSYSAGVRADIAAGYGFNRYLKVDARAALGIGSQFAGFYHPLFADLAVGGQTSLPLGPVSAALHAELSCYLGELTLSPGILFGIGRREWLTLGGRMHMQGFLTAWDPVAVDAFACFHLPGKWSIFAGTEIFYLTYAPAVTLGAGYNIFSSGD